MSDTPKPETSKPAAPAKNRLVVWLIALPVIIFGALMLIGLFSGCGGKTAANGVLNVYNWGEYIDPDVITDFEKYLDD